jgi:hypothetical protein
MKEHKFIIHVLFLLTLALIPVGSRYLSRILDENTTVMDIHETVAPQTFYVSMDAGFMNSNQNKSTVEFVEGANVIKLCQGDKLYVRAVISGTSPEKLLAGYLTLNDEVGKKDSKAKFSGALSPYVWDESKNVFVNAKHDFKNLDDPLKECENVFALFVDKDADNFKVSNEDRRGSYSVCIAPDANVLQRKSLEIFGWYNDSTKFVALDSDNLGNSAPIFNFSISGGLTPNASYNVVYMSSSHTESNEYSSYPLGSVKADAEGKVEFACYNFCANDSHVHEIRFVNSMDNTDVKHVTCGMKVVASKIYNITSEATSVDHTIAMVK